MNNLNDRQEMFCLEYLVDLNATQAAIRAGYSEDSARSSGCENLTKPNIQSRIAELKLERTTRVKIDADWVLKETKDIYELCKAKQDVKNSLKALDQISKHVDVKAYDRSVPITTDNNGSFMIQVNSDKTKDQLEELKSKLQ